MSHHLSFTTTESGARVADMFSVRLTPWHREGTLLDEAPTLERAIEIARLDYPVEKLPTRVVLPDGSTLASKKAYVTMRRDRNVELGAVGPDYTVVPNVDAFRATIGPLVDAGVLALETGGVLREGADAWLLGRFDTTHFGPIVREVFADEVLPYALVAVNHSGRRNNLLALTPIRVVCANTLGAVEMTLARGEASERHHAVRHTGDALRRMTEAAASLFAGIIERYGVIARQYALLKRTRVSPRAFDGLVTVPALGAHPTRRRGWNPEARMAEAVIERYERKARELRRMWREGAGHTGDESAWEAYNGAVELLDHAEALFPTRAGVYRTQSLLDGTLREMKQAVLTELVRFASSERTDDEAARENAELALAV